ncbi:MAG: YceI family protein [Caldilineaceae bacterium]|nr:YceI family protein [Caldilineaceae bacterium]MBP8110217.1 YceI family protein [Caldilineaceae bacterium]MBP8121812.1 YceI family protein [Caldilineaceae bacterium]MBP9072336.1 YceI family protein [Caldilineaceae bacterium]
MSWQIDSSHSHIQFSVRHMMISRVKGTFETFSGTVALDEANPANTVVNVSIEAASINTRDAQRDGHLQSPDFLDAATFPTLTFVSTKVEKTGTNHAKLYGDLTIQTVTRPVVLDVEYVGQAKSPWGTVSAGFSASTKINRKEWNLTWNQALETGGLLVGEEIAIEIDLELVKQPEAVAEAVA